ncbi:HtaA domain-containing protein [Isoptericola jiangsuensis]|uniref:HtaA domain-containing protein n=1 Tax=Isoptericola jiangsuensis TaxID=548579 RepID=UPI003AAC36F8
MTTTHRPAARGRAVAGLGVLALGLGTALVTVAPAQAAETRDVVAESGSVSWGFRESFRRYVGLQTAALPPVGPVAVGERITLEAPAEFDLDGTPAATADTTPPNETLPYLLPVAGGSVADEDNLSVSSTGGAVFAFPSHAFTVTVENVGIDVTDGTGTIVGDLSVVIPDNNLGHDAGTYGGDDVVLGDVATTTVSVADDEVSVTAAGVTLTPAGATALQGFLEAGAELDDLTVTADLDAAPASWSPAVQVSRTSGFDPAATSALTVDGSGFDPAANLNTGGRPPVAKDQPAGVYVVFGKFASDWRPSAGAASSARTVVSQKWAIPEPSYSQVKAAFPNVADQLVLMNDDGTFTAELEVRTEDSVDGVYGVYTYAAGGAAANAAQELATAVTFAAPDGSGEGDVDVDVEVPELEEPVDPGAFSWTISGTGAVSLGTAVQGDSAFTATGALHTVTVSDTRPEGTWTINGQVGSFVGGASSFSGSALGWAPTVTDGAANVGSPVVAGSDPGLTTTSLLASGAGATGQVDAVLGADLTLSIPLDTPAGDYSGVLTLTAVG